MNTRSNRQLLDRIDAAWRPFRDAVEWLGPEGMERHTPAGWTVKEMVARIAVPVRLEACPA